MPRRHACRLVLGGLLLGALGCDGTRPARAAPHNPSASPTGPAPAGVAARGRLKPKHGVRRVAGPSDFVAVVARLNVEEGDAVEVGEVIAIMDTLDTREARARGIEAQIAAKKAAIIRFEAEALNANAQLVRFLQLAGQGISPPTEREFWTTQANVAEAQVKQANAELASAQADLKTAVAERDLAMVRSPIAGRVLKIHARPGEKIGPDGIAELGQTDIMYAVAEVYETDVTRVKVGQRARVRSPALPAELTGTVERIGLKVGKLDALGTDPAAKTDARVVEVEVRLDDSEAVAGLTNLEVEVLISG